MKGRGVKSYRGKKKEYSRGDLTISSIFLDDLGTYVDESQG